MKRRLASVCVEELRRLARTDPAFWLLDGDLADSYDATDFEAEFPDRFVMCGIAEQNMVSFAAGMAACGARPWVFSFAAFLAYRAADQVRVSLSQTNMPVVLVGSHAGGCAGRNGKTHMATGDLAVFTALPGISVWTPSDAAETRLAVQTLSRSEGPSYIRMPREDLAELPGEAAPVREILSGGETLIVASGLAAHWALELAGRLAEMGREAPTVLTVARVKPLPERLVERVSAARRFYVVEDHVRAGGMADAIGRAAGRQPDRWFGWPDGWTGSGSEQVLREAAGLTTRAMADAICADALDSGLQ